MKAVNIALLLAIAITASACATKETKTEAPPSPVSTSTPPPDQPIASPQAVDCQPGKNTKTSGKGKKTSKPVAADCPPPAKASPPPAPAPAPVAEAPAAKAGTSSEQGKPRTMKSRDGTFEGEVYGNIPPGSKWSKLQIGMEQHEVERILGVTHEIRHTPTGKAFMPFYFGTDRFRNEHVYRGQGSVSYTSGGHWGAGRGVLMMINYDPNI